MKIKKIFKLLEGGEEDRAIAFEILKSDEELLTKVILVHSFLGNISFRNSDKFKEIAGYPINDWWYPLDETISKDQDWLLNKIKQILEKDET